MIAFALHEFDAYFARFPDATTIEEVRNNTDSTLPLGTSSSNDYFRQLIAYGIANSEEMFYARSSFTQKPDNRMDGAEALAKGECAFTYVPGLATDGFPPSTPVALMPLVQGKRAFDIHSSTKYYDGKIVILNIDGSVRTPPLDPSGKVHFDGKDLLGFHPPYWTGEAPALAWPE